MFITVTILSIATLISWGLSDYLAGRSGRSLSTYVANFVIQLTSLALITPIALFYGMSFDDPGGLLIIALVAGLFTLAYVYFIRAMAKGPAGVAAPIANSYAAVTLIVSLVLFGVTLSEYVIVALLLVVAGAMFISSDRDLFKGKVLHSQTVKLAAVPLVAWGLGFALLNQIVDTYSWHEILFAMTTAMVVLAFIVMLFKTPHSTIRYELLTPGARKTAAWSGLLLVTGSVALFWAADIGGQFVIPAAIAAASPLVTSFAAYWFDKEKLSRLNRVGAVLVVIGIVLLNI